MKKFLTAGLAIILALGLCACGGSKSPATTAAPADTTAAPADTTAPADSKDENVVIEPVELSVASYLAEQAPNNYVIKQLQDKTNEILGGEYVTLTLYPSGTLAGGGEMLDALDSGLCDIGLVNVSLFINRLPIIELTEQPGILFESGQQVSAAVYDFINSYEPAKAELDGYKLLGVMGAGNGAIYSKKPVHSMADMKNMQIRCTNATKEAVEVTGAIPVTLEWSECYEGLRNNLVDALYADAVAGKFINVQEVAEYYTFLPTLNTNTLYLMGDKSFEKLQPEVAEAILQAADAVQKEFVVPVLSDITMNLNAEFLNGFKEITILSDAELEKIVTAQAPILDAYVGKLSNGAEALAAFQAELDKYGAEYSAEATLEHIKTTAENVFIGE